MIETFASYSVKLESRGRKPPLPANKRKPPQSTVKVNDFILPFVKELKGNLKNKTLTADILQSLFDVLNGKDLSDTKIPADNVTETNLKWVQKYDVEHLKVIKLQSNVNSLKSDIKHVKSKIKQLQHKEHDCQSLTNIGIRCKNPAKLKAKWHGVEINVCLQHSKNR